MIIEVLLLAIVCILGIIALVLDFGIDKFVGKLERLCDVNTGLSSNVSGLRNEFIYKKPYENLQKDMEQQQVCYGKLKKSWLEQVEENGKLKAQLVKKGRR